MECVMTTDEHTVIAREMVASLGTDNPGIFVSSGTCGNRLRALTWWVCGLGVVNVATVAGMVVVLLAG